VIFLLTLAGMSFADRPLLHSADSEAALRTTFVSPSTKVLFAAAALVMVLAVSAPTLVVLIEGHAVSPDAAWLAVPKPVPPWKVAASEPEWRPALAGPDREFLDNFTDGQGTVERYVALFVSHGDNNIMRDLGRPAAGSKPWERGNIQTAQVRIGDRVHDVEVSEIRSEDGHRRLVWSFYVVDRKTVAGTLRAKLLDAYASVTGGGRAVAYVAVSTPIDSAGIDHQAELQQFLGSMTSLDRYIEAMN
jgi:EpsI family protein